MFEIDEIKHLVKERLSEKRYLHSVNVANECKNLAHKWGEDEDKSYFSGLIHDICKEYPKSEQQQMTEESNMMVSDVELSVPSLWHSIAGAWYAKNSLNVCDLDILNSIRYHTCARKDMSLLEKIVFVADKISAERDYKDIDKLRQLAYTNLDLTMLELLKFSITDVVSKNSKVPVQTIEAYNQYHDITKK